MAIRKRRINMQNGKVMTPTKQERLDLSTAEKGFVDSTNIVSIRREPSEGSPVVGYAAKGEEVAVLEEVQGHPDEENRYCKVRFGKHQIGYVSSNYVKRRCSYGW